MVGSAFCFNGSLPPTSINLCCSTDPQALNGPCVFVRLCVGLSVWVCLCVSEEEENDEGEKKSKLVLQMEKREKKERNGKLIK